MCDRRTDFFNTQKAVRLLPCAAAPDRAPRNGAVTTAKVVPRPSAGNELHRCYHMCTYVPLLLLPYDLRVCPKCVRTYVHTYVRITLPKSQTTRSQNNV